MSSAGTMRRRLREKEEDDVIVQEALEGGTEVQRHYDASPPFIKGGAMKHYQLTALNWLISRHDAGISGILADEMGEEIPAILSRLLSSLTRALNNHLFGRTWENVGSDLDAGVSEPGAWCSKAIPCRCAKVDAPQLAEGVWEVGAVLPGGPVPWRQGSAGTDPR
jgi:hypothetical protein